MDFSSLGYAGLAASGLASIGNLGASYLNFGLQNEQFDYQKALQEKIFSREDTALQRRMADAKSAGLNPYSVINSGGAGAGSVVKTQAPQLNSNFGGLVDMVNTMLDMEYKKAQTEGERQRTLNAEKEGLFLDSKITGQNWQNSMLGVDYDNALYNTNNVYLNTLRNMAEFNYDFGTNYDIGADKRMYWMEPKSGIYGSIEGQIKQPLGKSPGNWYSRNYNYDSMLDTASMRDWYEWLWYRDNKDWMYDIQKQNMGYQNAILSHQASMAQKEDSWYNWNQGFNMVDTVFDDVTGLLFKKLDFGLNKESNASSNYRNYAQGSYYNRKR